MTSLVAVAAFVGALAAAQPALSDAALKGVSTIEPAAGLTFIKDDKAAKCMKRNERCVKKAKGKEKQLKRCAARLKKCEGKAKK